MSRDLLTIVSGRRHGVMPSARIVAKTGPSGILRFPTMISLSVSDHGQFASLTGICVDEQGTEDAGGLLTVEAEDMDALCSAWIEYRASL